MRAWLAAAARASHGWCPEFDERHNAAEQVHEHVTTLLMRVGGGKRHHLDDRHHAAILVRQDVAVHDVLSREIDEAVCGWAEPAPAGRRGWRLR